MNAKDILDDQVIHVKRGRTNGLGFEPAFNSYFDFYLNSKYFGEPLLEMEDVTFHLFLRKNLNDHNKAWKMPTIKQMMKRFKIGQHRIEAIMRRLEQAHLLTKESGFKKGKKTVRNDYILSDPISTLDEFLTVATEGVFGRELLPEFCIAEMNTLNQDSPASVAEMAMLDEPRIAETATLRVAETAMDQQTLNTKQTAEKSTDPCWQAVLDDFEVSLPAKTFERFVSDATLLEIVDGVAIVGTPQAYARDWIENRLSDRIRRLLGVAAVRCVVVEHE